METPKKKSDSPSDAKKITDAKIPVNQPISDFYVRFFLTNIFLVVCVLLKGWFLPAI